MSISNRIAVEKIALPTKVIGEIKSALTFTNQEKLDAQKQQQGGWWKMPDVITLWDEDLHDEILYLPRGFMEQLHHGLVHYNIPFEWHMETKAPRAEYEYNEIKLRDYQDSAKGDILEQLNGVWQSPPASGKTVTVLATLAELQTKTLIVVNKKEIAEQWRDRARQFLGIEMGILGDGKDDLKDVTVAMQQTLWSRRDELQKDGFFDQWGFVCLDECHHLPARTFTDTLQRFTAHWRLGVSGTPAKHWHDLPIIEAALGPIFHVTPKKYLRDEGWLMTPKVIIHNTTFQGKFFPTHRNNIKIGSCAYKDCYRPKNKVIHRNNYSDIISDLITDDERNKMIAQEVASSVSQGRAVLVLSKRLDHLKRLREFTAALRGGSGRLWDFTGKQSTEERMKIQQDADDGSCVLFSTIADEALDIPRLDTLFLAFPSKNVETIRQQIGRVERPHIHKLDPIVHDYFDNLGVFKAQLSERELHVYFAEDLEVISSVASFR